VAGPAIQPNQDAGLRFGCRHWEIFYSGCPLNTKQVCHSKPERGQAADAKKITAIESVAPFCKICR
jgi:hypothetical protein